MPITPIAAEAKYDGIRLVLERDGSRVWIFTEDKKRDRAKFLPGVVKEMKKLPCTSVILDSETVIWAGGAPIPRHEMIKIVVSKTPLVEEEIHCNIFDCLYYNGKDLTDLPWKERQKYLKKVLPKDLKYLKRVVPCIITDRRSFDNCIRRASKAAGSEGAMLKSTESKYVTGRSGDWCLPAEGYVYGNSSVLEASQVRVGQKVYDHNGKFASIIGIKESNFDGELICIKPSNLPKFSLTPEHRVLVIKNGRRWRKRKSWRAFFWREDKPRKTSRRANPSQLKSLNKDFREHLCWTKAGDIQIGDYLLFPRLKPNLFGNSKNRFRSHDFFELCGWFVSEGYSDHPSRTRISQSKSSPDYNRIQKLLERLNLNFATEPKRFTVKDSRLTAFLKHRFGSHSYTKKLPAWLLNSDTDRLKSFLRGYWHGDGCHTDQCLTVSRELAWGLVLLFGRFGVIPSWFTQNRKAGPLRVSRKKMGRRRKLQEHILDIPGVSEFLTSDSLEIKRSKFTSVLFHKFDSISLTNGDKKRRDMEFFVLPIRSIKRIPYSGSIYHFETSRETFAAPVILHNSKLKLTFELKMSVIGILRKPLPLRPAPKSDLTGDEALRTFRRLQRDSKTYILRCAYRGKTGRLEPIMSDHKLTPGDLELKWDAAKKEWKGTEDPRIWQMAKGMPHRKRGEYAYGNTYGKKLEPGPKMGSIVTVRPIMVRKFTAEGKTMFSWMFPNLREIDPERSAPDSWSDMERIARESAARTPGGKKQQMQIMSAIHEAEG